MVDVIEEDSVAEFVDVSESFLVAIVSVDVDVVGSDVALKLSEVVEDSVVVSLVVRIVDGVSASVASSFAVEIFSDAKLVVSSAVLVNDSIVDVDVGDRELVSNVLNVDVDDNSFGTSTVVVTSNVNTSLIDVVVVSKIADVVGFELNEVSDEYEDVPILLISK
ncbi:unnamed protein product [Caenorhabditis bovis]|uniref:Uncharacterized protein n=1 Tax=Caenorhabditis bovis TaxID=2654633 RepID=A0A8S1F7J1_9PELO|nr:unnamed protein product [Caenorhabditis bovis]